MGRRDWLRSSIMWRSIGDVHPITFHDRIDRNPVMRLPQIQHAFVDERKVRDYLLAVSHPSGKGKARFFNSLGFQQNLASELQNALLGHAANNDIKSVMETQFGSKYVIEGPLAAPNGQFAQVRAI